MNSIMKSVISGMVALTASAMIVSSASAAKTLKIQLAVPTTSDEAKIVQDFADDVENLTEGEVKLELLPAGAV
ncbi:MAG: C4-dicarboxylate ABC transporter substrate-binding protein, partial [Candidatus Puniceispirillaceae bacterium]